MTYPPIEQREIWEACWATSAASTFLDPIAVDRMEFLDDDAYTPTCLHDRTPARPHASIPSYSDVRIQASMSPRLRAYTCAYTPTSLHTSSPPCLHTTTSVYTLAHSILLYLHTHTRAYIPARLHTSMPTYTPRFHPRCEPHFFNTRGSEQSGVRGVETVPVDTGIGATRK
jgi:hypothetical protein